jgi:hypothetical protein
MLFVRKTTSALVDFFASRLKKPRFLIDVLLLGIIAFLTLSLFIADKRHNREVNDLQNNLSTAVGSLEIAEGVQMRQAIEITNLNRRADDILGEESLLLEEIRDRNLRIEDLVQVNATLTEQIIFSSGTSGTATTTRVPRRPVTNGTAETTQEPVLSNEELSEPLQNLRVDFDLVSDGFQITGYTETNPSFAMARLAQLEPFVVDIAISQDRTGAWSAMAAEQNRRLRLEIGQFAVNPNVTKEKWFERIAVGLATRFGTEDIEFSPIFGIEAGRRVYAFAGPAYNITQNSWSANLGILWRPFRTRR